MISTLEQHALDQINIDDMVQAISDLVAIRSLDGEEAAIQREMAKRMTDIGLETDLWQIDEDGVSEHPAYCVEVERSEPLGLVGWLGGDAGNSLILNGHVDVVPVGNEANWSVPPWQGTVKDGCLYGRGALDMKGGLVCALFAAKAIRDAGIQLKGKLLIQSVIGEEDGGLGTLATVLRGHSADAAIIMEPTELMIAPAQAGALNFRITVPGFAAHGSMREEGVSAIEKFIPLYQGIMALERERNEQNNDPLFQAYDLPYAICIGRVNAGNWASTVADELTFEGRYGIAVDEDIEQAKHAFTSVITDVCFKDEWLKENPPVIEWWGGQFAPAGIPVNDPIVTTVANAFTHITTKQAKIQGMTYGADMRLLVNEGNTPTLMFGPGDVRKAHQPDEYVPIADLEAVVQTLTLTAMRFCGVENRRKG